MSEDIFNSIADFEKRADALVARARHQAAEMRTEVERRLEALAQELERDYGLKREQIQKELDKRRDQLLHEMEKSLRETVARLDSVRRERIQPIINEVIREFLEQTRGH